jgi:gliding motility-associated-like protein
MLLKTKWLIILLSFAGVLQLSAQKQTNQWYFGYRAALDFNSGSPVPQTNSVMNSWGGCASIADSNGDLLFYTNGLTVYDHSHNIMQNGNGLLGTSTYYNYGQSVIIIPRPGNPNVYYIFSISRNHSSYNDALRYTTVNTLLNNGKGAVLYRNTLLLEKTLDAKITATQHANGIDYWVIVHEANSNKFYSYLVSSAGVNSMPVTSFSGRTLFFPYTYNWWNGSLKTSTDGSKLANTYHHYYLYSSDSTACELFDFNNATGKISNAKDLYIDNFNYYWYSAASALEFSPDGTKLYITDHPNYWLSYQFDLYQFEVDAGSESAINSTRTKVGITTRGSYWYWYSGAMQLASDGKIYVNRYYTDYLGVINAPNQKGVGCCFEDSAVGLAGRINYNGLPLFVTSWLYKPVFDFEDVCVNDSAHFYILNESCLDSVLWNFADPAAGSDSVSQQFAPAHKFSAPGSYDVSLITYRSGTEDTAIYTINVYDNPSVQLFINDTSQCFNGNYFTYADSSSIGNGSISDKLWDLGDQTIFHQYINDTNHSYTYTDTFDVKLVLTSDKGCKDSVVQSVFVNPEPGADYYVNDSVQCLRENIFYFTNTSSVSYGSLSYQWSFGDTSTSTLKDPDYVYYTHDTFQVEMIATSNMNCKDTVTSRVYVHPSPTALFFTNDTTQCLAHNNFIFTDSSSIFNDSLSYAWDFDDGTLYYHKDTNHIYQADGTYEVELIVNSSLQCADTFTQKITVHPDPEPDFDINDSAQCFFGNEFHFTNTSQVNSGSMTYYWDFGDNSSSNLKDPIHSYLTYDTFHVKLICSTDFGCIDSFEKTVIVHPMPIADFSVNDSIQCLNENVFNFSNNSSIAYGNLSHDWSLGNSYTSSQTNISGYSYQAENTYVVQLISYSANNCVDTLSKEVVVHPSPTAVFNINNDKQCYNWNRFYFTNYSTINSGSMVYEWSFGDNTFSTAKDPTKKYASDDSFSVELKTISNHGCRDSSSQEIIVFPNPLANFQINDSSQCFDGNNFIFYNNSAINSGSMSYFWNFGDSDTSRLTTPSHTYSKADTFTVMLIATSDQNCYDSISKQTLIHVHPMPEAAFSIIDSMQCLANNQFDFSNASTLSSGSLSYLWLFGDNDSSQTEHPSHSYQYQDSFLVKLYAISDWNCKDSATHAVVIHPQPEVRFSLNEPSQCLSGNSFTFTDSSSIASGNIHSLSYLLSDGNSNSSPNYTHSFGTADTFTVTLRAESALGCIDSLQQEVYVRPMPTADFTINANSQCLSGNLLELDDTSNISSGSITSWLWETGDSQMYATQHVQHSYTYFDSFQIKLLVSSTYNCKDSITKEVYIHPMPQAKFGIVDDAQCVNTNAFEFKDSSSLIHGSIKNYVWLTGDTQSFSSKDLVHTYSYHDTFIVWHYVESALGCTDSFSSLVYVHPAPRARFYANDSLQCLEGNNFNMINKSQIDWGNMSYFWQFGDDSNSTAYEPSHHFLNHKSYVIKLLVRSDLSCKDSFEYPVVVHPMPKADFHFSQLCLEQNILFTDTSRVEAPDIVTQWNWSFGNGDTSAQQHPVYMYTNPGNKSVMLTVTTDNGCTDDTTQSILINEHVNNNSLIRATVTTDEHILIEWDAATQGVPLHYILQKSTDGSNYTTIAKLDNASFSYEDKMVQVQSSTYFYRVIVEDSCRYQSGYSNYGRNILLSINDDEEFPILTWTAYEQWAMGVFEYVAEIYDEPTALFEELEHQGGNILSYEDKITEKNQANYCYRITAYSASNPDIISQSNVVCVPTTLYAFMPNAFSPNGDGINDEFVVKAKNVMEYKLSIFNRWGELMFTTEDYHKSWDGTCKGKICPVGTYTFVMQANGSNGQSKSIKGTLQLIR